MLTRIALLCDYLEEGWPSMDLAAEMLFSELRNSGGIDAQMLRPAFVRRFGAVSRRRAAFNADRVMNRFFDYPRFVRARKNDFDLFHIIDHTYSHLAHAAGPQRCIVSCHDIDAFRPLIESGFSPPMRAMARRTAAGLRDAAAVMCVSAATRDDIVRHRLAPAERVNVNHNGVSETFRTCPDADADREACRLLGPPHPGRIEILHVGSTIARKRIDLLLRIFASVRRELPAARLIRVGGEFSPAQRGVISKLRLPPDSIAVLPFLEPRVLAAVYRRAAIALMTSRYEGFGLPALEAQACGTPAVLSDIAALREVGGPAAVFCPLDDVDRWCAAITQLADERMHQPHRWHERRLAGVRWAARFTWSGYARRAADLYQSVAAPR